MPDIVTINAVLTSIKTATDIAKAIRSADVSLEKAETKLKMAELIEALADAKAQTVEVRDVIADKDKRIADLQAAFDFKGKLVRYVDAYYEADADGNAAGDPYCTRCWEVDRKLVHLNQVNAFHSGCASCKSSFIKNRVPFLSERAT